MSLSQPTLLVDLAQAERNLKHLCAALPADMSVRLASKSIRCPELLKLFIGWLGERAKGVMCFHPEEIAFLHAQGIDDVLLAYPLYNLATARALARQQKELQHQKMYLMVDLPEHLEVLATAAHEYGTRLQVVVDLDMATALPGLKFGVYRSSVQNVAQLERLLQLINANDALEFAGTMSYEAQIAGIADHDPRERWIVAAVQRFLKRLAVNRVARKRREFAGFLAKQGFVNLPVLNGGGSGSVHSTGADSLVNEVTFGSGILCPALFEHYKGLELKPAMAFALPVARRPDAQHVTAYGGGYIASGAHSPTKQPRLLWPQGWSLLANEGLGEVQTPLKRHSAQAPDVTVGEAVYFIPAKSGETMERFTSLTQADLSQQPPQIGERTFATYRGYGVCFG